MSSPAPALPQDDPFIAAALARWPGAEIIDRATAPKGVDELSPFPGMQIFSACAAGIVDAGWSVFPQERRDRRLPGRVDGRGMPRLAWGEYALRSPRPDEIRQWSLTCGDLNVAGIMGRASGGAFAVDVDMADPADCVAVERLMEEHLGVTPFKRVGRYPRFAAIYRQSTEADAARIPSRSWRFTPREGEETTEDGIEILAHGKSITFYGLHHKTGQRFRWVNASQPRRLGPEHAPLVTRDQLYAFLDAVDAYRSFTKARSTTDSSVWVYDPAAAIVRADGRFATIQDGWTCDEAGKVIDGRENFLFRLAATTVRRNEHLVRAGVDDGFAAIKGLVHETFTELADVSGRWQQILVSEVNDKVRRLADEAIRDGKFSRPAYVDPEKHEAVYAQAAALDPAVAADPFDDILSHIRRQDRKPLTLVKPLCTKADENRAMDRRLRDGAEREAARGRGTRAQRRIIDAWLRRVWASVRGEAKSGKAVLLKGPPGLGKSTTLIDRIAHMSSPDQLGPLGKAIGIMMPSGQNLSEMQGRAFGAGMRDIWDPDVQDMLSAGERAGVTVQVYRGRIAAGCMRPDTMRTVMDAGIGGGGLCRRDSSEEGEPPELCPHYHECPVIKQLALVQHADVILLPSAYLTCIVPAEVTARVGALVIDESHWGLLAHTADLPLEALRIERPSPEVSKEDKAAGILGEGLCLERNRVAEAVLEGAKRGLHPVEAVEGMDLTGFDAGTTPLDLLDSALAVTGASWSRSRSVTPDISAHELRKLSERVDARFMGVEWRLWWLVKDRLQALAHDEATANGRQVIEDGMAACDGRYEAIERACRAAGCERRAYGDVDARLQLVMRQDDKGRDLPSIRLSWRTKPNFDRLPLLFLDASGNAEILRKVWPGRTIREIVITAPAHMRVVAMVDHQMSDSQLVGRTHRHLSQRLATVSMASLARDLVSTVSTFYAWGPVLVGATKKARTALQAAWRSPENTFWSHYGALRGLNVYETCVAAIGIGRQELPSSTVDGLVSALTFDQDSQPRLIDEYGTGDMRTEKAVRILRMRDGRDVAIPDTVYDTGWAQLVRSQTREEEIRQFAGRLRPIHRAGEPPVLFLAAQCIPSEYVIDEVCAVSDVARPIHRSRIHDVARRTAGVYAPELAYEVAPDLMPGPDAIDFLRLGLEQGGRLAEGYRPVAYVESTEGNAARRTAWVASTEPDPAGHVEAAFERAGLPVIVVEVGAPVREPVALPDVKPDKLSLQLSDLSAGSSMDEVRAALAAHEEDARGRVMDRRREANGGVEPCWWYAHRLEPGLTVTGSLDEQVLWSTIRGAAAVVDNEAVQALTPPVDVPSGERVPVFAPVRQRLPERSRSWTGQAA